MADDPSLLTKTVAQVEAEVQGHGRKLDDACDSITIVMDMLESFVTRDELEQHRPLPAAGATDGDVSRTTERPRSSDSETPWPGGQVDTTPRLKSTLPQSVGGLSKVLKPYNSTF